MLRWLVQGRKLPAARFSAAGYADTHPRFANDTAAHRATNRRVEIIIVAADAANDGAVSQPAAAPTTTTTSVATTATTTATSTHGATGNG